jgi:hypothetical protein
MIWLNKLNWEMFTSGEMWRGFTMRRCNKNGSPVVIVAYWLDILVLSRSVGNGNPDEHSILYVLASKSKITHRIITSYYMPDFISNWEYSELGLFFVLGSHSPLHERWHDVF